jgi:hypothetical protein
MVIENLADADVFSLSLLSRRLHYLALPVYLIRCNVPDPFSISLPGGMVFLRAHNFNALPALQTALFIPSISSMTCTFRHRDYITDIRRLASWISRVSHVTEARFNLPFNSDKDILTDGVTLWAIEHLLAALVEKSCLKLSFKGFSGANLCSSRSLRRAQGIEFRDVPGTPSPLLSRNPISSLQELRIHSPVVLFPVFKKWTINSINSSSIVTLIFSCFELPTEEWASILPHLTLHALRELTISVSTMDFHDFAAFFTRHPLIVTLDLTCGSINSAADHRLRDFVNPNLTTLDTTPEYASVLLNSPITFPNISTITIEPYNQEHGLDFGALDKSLATLAQRKDNLALTLNILGKARSLEWISRTEALRVERLLHCVKELSLARLPHLGLQMTQADILLLPPWLALFPALREVHLSFLPNLDVSVRQDFFRSMIVVCPGVEVIWLKLDQYVVHSGSFVPSYFTL